MVSRGRIDRTNELSAKFPSHFANDRCLQYRRRRGPSSLCVLNVLAKLGPLVRSVQALIPTRVVVFQTQTLDNATYFAQLFFLKGIDES